MREQEKKKRPVKPAAGTPQAKKPPLSKEDAIKKMVETDPEKAAAMLREILNRK